MVSGHHVKRLVELVLRVGGQRLFDDRRRGQFAGGCVQRFPDGHRIRVVEHLCAQGIGHLVGIDAGVEVSDHVQRVRRIWQLAVSVVPIADSEHRSNPSFPRFLDVTARTPVSSQRFPRHTVFYCRLSWTTPASIAAARYASARVSTVWCALRPLGLGTTHTTVSPIVRS